MPEPTNSLIAAEEIRAQIDRILASRSFAQAERMRRFLRFTVEQALAGYSDNLKEYTIGVEVFDRDASYDPRVDPIVRVEARRLRSKLQRYYSTDGAADELLVEYRTGSYAPSFRARNEPQPEHESPRDARTVAVLPFQNLSSEPDNDYFSDGLTQEVIHRLTQLRDLRVSAWDSALRFKDAGSDPREAARRLGVATILRGSVRRAGDRLRVAAQLLDVAGGHYLWSETYEREMSDIFAIQDDIARAIAQALRLQLAGEPARRATGNTEAYNLYLQGLFHASKRTEPGLKRGVELFLQSLAVDRDFALGHAGMAHALVLMADYHILAPRIAMPQAKNAAQRAIALDPSLAEAHAALATVQAMYEWDKEQAEVSYRRAIELNPGYATAHFWFSSDFLAASCRIEEAMIEAKLAQRLDPLSPIITVCVGELAMCIGDHETALREYDRALEIDPHFYKAYASIGRVYLQQGRFDEAIGILEQAHSLAGDLPIVLGALAQAHALAGRPAEARTRLEQLRAIARDRWVSSVTLALVHRALGEVSECLDLLEKAYEQREVSVSLIALHPVYDSLRGERRFQALLRKMGLPQTPPPRRACC